MGQNAGGRGEGMWESRGSNGNIFHGQPFTGMANQGPPMHGGMQGAENRGVTGRDSWGSDELAGTDFDIAGQILSNMWRFVRQDFWRPCLWYRILQE